MASTLARTYRLLTTLSVVCACAGSWASNSSTVTVTVSRWTTTMTISPQMTYGICASLVSASEPCPVITKKSKTAAKVDKKNKNKKKVKEEDKEPPPLVPVYVAFDDELHEYLLEYFDPSSVIKIQPTATLETRENSSPVIVSPSTDSDDVADYANRPYVMNHLNQAVKKVLGMQDTVTRTQYLTSTITSTIAVTTTVKTFILENCIPSKFNFSTCS